MASPRAFQRRLSQVAREYRRNADSILGQVTDRAAEYLIEGTPVGGGETTPDDPHPGRAASNWKLRRGGPDAYVSTHDDPERAKSQAHSASLRVKADDVVFVSNSVEYIRKLNDGSSFQAPTGFIPLAVRRAINDVRARARLLRRR